jgi:uncharacterized oligopeptide transporter (OPT) family protein
MNEPIDREQHWYEHVYQPGVKQFTLRAVLFGMVIGALMCLSNLYVFFATGWSMGVTVTAAVLLFGSFSGLRSLGLVKQPFGPLENNVATTVASGAGYMTGGGNMAAFGALLMVTTLQPQTLPMIAWFAAIAALGVFVAIPIKRQLINHEDLPFPTGTATAATIRTIHGVGADAASSGPSKEARALGFAALGAALLAAARDLQWTRTWTTLPDKVKLPFEIAGVSLEKWSLYVKSEVVLIGGGMLMSFRTVWSMLLGGILTFGVLAPALLERGWIAAATYKDIVAWTVWPGAAILVSAGLTSFALDWRSVLRTFSGLGNLFRRGAPRPSADSIESVECPPAWFPIGFAVLSPVIVLLMVVLFQIPWWAGLIALPLSIVMGFVAARVTGETDVTPTKAFGPVTQLVYGVVTPNNLPGNIMSANVTGGVGLHAADLLTTLKTGWLLGGNPRAQFYAQLFGVLVGAAIIVPAFHLLIEDPSMLGGEKWPAPSCVVWAGVSKMFSGGLDELKASARTAIWVGLALGTALAIAEKFAPKPLKPFVPSPSGIGLSMVIPGANSIAMFVGGALAEALRRLRPNLASWFNTSVGSGLIAGESLMGVVAAIVKAKKWLPIPWD